MMEPGWTLRAGGLQQRRWFFAKGSEGWEKLQACGVSDSMVEALNEAGFKRPTIVQEKVVPEVAKGGDVLFTAQTGTGKTLAYLIPLVEMVLQDEAAGIPLRPRRPRALIITPTRELAHQVISVAKSLCHRIRFSSAVFTGGRQFKRFSDERLERGVDIAVCTLDRLAQMREISALVTTDLRYIVLDEADTLVDPDNGFGPLLNDLVGDLRRRKARDADHELFHPRLQLVFASATMRPSSEQRVLALAPSSRIVGGMGLHKTLPKLDKAFRYVRGDEDRLAALASLLLECEEHKQLKQQQQQQQQQQQADHRSTVGNVMGGVGPDDERHGGAGTLIFCNTIASAKAVRYFLLEKGWLNRVAGFHGDMKPEERKAAYEAFRDGKLPIMVATDIAARGLDTVFVDHVIMFDFPRNAEEFLHRAGRTARAGKKGQLSAFVTKKSSRLAEAIKALTRKGEAINEVALANLDATLGQRPSSSSRSKGKSRSKSSYSLKTADSSSTASGKRDIKGNNVRSTKNTTSRQREEMLRRLKKRGGI